MGNGKSPGAGIPASTVPNRRISEKKATGQESSGGVLLDQVGGNELFDELGDGIGGAKPSQVHEVPVGGHAPVCAVERDNSRKMRAGFHENLRIR